MHTFFKIWPNFFAEIKLLDEFGNFSSPPNPNQPIHVEYVIWAEHGKKISLRFNVIDLDSRNGDYISVC